MGTKFKIVETQKINKPVLTAEFQCRYNPRWANKNGQTDLSRVHLTAISSDNSNVQWAATTNVEGEIKLDITQPDMMDTIKLGKKYVVYIVPIEE